MYAVIRTGGKQYKVAPQDVLQIEKIEGAAGDAVRFSDVLMVGGEGEPRFGSPLISGAAVSESRWFPRLVHVCLILGFAMQLCGCSKATLARSASTQRIDGYRMACAARTPSGTSLSTKLAIVAPCKTASRHSRLPSRAFAFAVDKDANFQTQASICES